MEVSIKPALKYGIYSIRDFTSALAEMEQVLATMGNMTEQTDMAWKLQYVGLRRELQHWISTLGTAAQQCREIKQQSDLAAELRKRINRLRSTVALHQANWPVVSIDAENPDYAESSNSIHLAAISFGRLARKIIATSARA